MSFTDNNPPAAPTTGAPAPGEPPAGQPPAQQWVQTEGLPAGYRGQIFTQEEVEERLNRARSEERDKLYRDREAERAELARLKAEAEQRQAAEEAQRAEAQRLADEQRRQQEAEELDAKSLAQKYRDEMQQQMAAERQRFEAELARRDAMLEQERRLAALEQYRVRIVAENADQILPELQDLVTGNSEEEINRSVTVMVERTARIMANVADATQTDPRMVQGVPPRAPAMGPESLVGGQRTFSAQELRDMPLSEYAKIRDQLPTGRAGTGNGDRGLFG